MVQLTDKQLIVLMAVGALGLYLAYKVVEGEAENIGDAMGSVFDELKAGFDVTEDTNFIYRGANWIGGEVTGDKNWSLGTAAYDWMN